MTENSFTGYKKVLEYILVRVTMVFSPQAASEVSARDITLLTHLTSKQIDKLQDTYQRGHLSHMRISALPSIMLADRAKYQKLPREGRARYQCSCERKFNEPFS